VQLTTVKLPGASKNVRRSTSLSRDSRKKPDGGIIGSGQLSQLARRRQILRRGELEFVRFRSHNTSMALSEQGNGPGADGEQKASDVQPYNVVSEHTSLMYDSYTPPYVS